LGITSENQDATPGDDLGPVNQQRLPEPRPRKRRRSPANDLNDDVAPVFTTSKRSLEIGDGDAVRDFYTQRFQCIQQTACRAIAKDLIKVLCPKKQASNPYVRRDSTTPTWWPKPWGPGPKERVRHIEPDHLLKDGTPRSLSYLYGNECS
jgi:hypothetical protein